MSRSALLADVGGTNVRFALSDLGAAPALRQIRHFATKDFTRLEDAARLYLAEVGAKPDYAVLGVAGPVRDQTITLTNIGWHFGADGVGRALGIARVALINDFEAVALSIPHLGRTDRVVIGPAVDGEKGAPVAVAGPGTGFGVGGLVNGHALVTEGGHADFAPSDEIEIEVLKFLRRRFGHVSAERLLSGPGLVNLHDALSAIEGRGETTLDPHAITAQALADPASFAAVVVARFCAILGSVAGNIALTMGARGGVMLAGGILPGIRALLAASPFRERFEAKGRFAAYLKAIPTSLIVQEHAGLIGAISKAMQMDEGGR
jgi:glucokinase